MQESDLIFDWNIVDYEFNRNPANHPHEIWFDDETLRDGLQSPSARNPTIEEKIELLSYMERLGIQKVALGLPGAGPFHVNHIDAMLSPIVENDYSIRPRCAVRTVVSLSNSANVEVSKDWVGALCHLSCLEGSEGRLVDDGM